MPNKPKLPSKPYATINVSAYWWNPSGYRHYPADAITNIRFIKRAQQAGFTLKEIATLLSLDGSHCADVRQLAELKCQQIDQHIKSLTALRQALDSLVNTCQQTNSSARCSILDVFNDDDTSAS